MTKWCLLISKKPEIWVLKPVEDDNDETNIDELCSIQFEVDDCYNCRARNCPITERNRTAVYRFESANWRTEYLYNLLQQLRDGALDEEETYIRIVEWMANE